TIEFPHSHGLGVAFVGRKNGTSVGRLIEMLNDDPALYQMTQHHFASLGEQAVNLFVTSFELGRQEESKAQLGALNEEVSRLRQELAVANMEKTQIAGLMERRPFAR